MDCHAAWSANSDSSGESLWAFCMVLVESVVVHDRVRAGIPTIIIIVGTQPLEQLLEFFRELCLSISAERAYAQAVSRFIEWLSVRAIEFSANDQRNLLYTAFTHDLAFGSYRDVKMLSILFAYSE